MDDPDRCCVVAVTAAIKHLGDSVSAPEAAFLRQFIGLFLRIPVLEPLFRMRIDRVTLSLFVLRGLCHDAGVTFWFHAVHISIAEMTNMRYLSPVYVSLGAAIFMGERLGWPRIMAIMTALLEMMLILRSGFRKMSAGHLTMLVRATMFAASYLIAKRRSQMVSSTIVAKLPVGTTVGLVPGVVASWVNPTMADLGWLFVAACLATAGHAP